MPLLRCLSSSLSSRPDASSQMPRCFLPYDFFQLPPPRRLPPNNAKICLRFHAGVFPQPRVGWSPPSPVPLAVWCGCGGFLPKSHYQSKFLVCSSSLACFKGGPHRRPPADGVVGILKSMRDSRGRKVCTDRVLGMRTHAPQDPPCTCGAPTPPTHPPHFSVGWQPHVLDPE